MMSDAPCSPLAPLAACHCMQFLDVMFSDSGDGTAGSLDQRLVADIARMLRLEELEVGATEEWEGAREAGREGESGQ